MKAKKADTAIYVIRRNAGEDDDRKAKKGDYYLTEREEENLRKITQNFENTIVVFNTCVMDASFLETITGIKGAVLMGLAGNECGNALADILEIEIDKDISDIEKKREFIRQIRNPYLYRQGEYIVKLSFADTDATLADRLKEYIEHMATAGL